MQIEVTRGYDMNSWHEDLRRFYFKPGAFAEDVTFLFTDTQIVLEEFLEDINNTLNSGTTYKLFNYFFFIIKKIAEIDKKIAISNFGIFFSTYISNYQL